MQQKTYTNSNTPNKNNRKRDYESFKNGDTHNNENGTNNVLSGFLSYSKKRKLENNDMKYQLTTLQTISQFDHDYNIHCDTMAKKHHK